MADLIDKAEFDKVSAYAKELQGKVSDLEAELFRRGKDLSQKDRELERLSDVESEAADLAAQIRHKDSQIGQLSGLVAQQQAAVAKADGLLSVAAQVKSLLAGL